jgi:hypothetical protein
VGQCVHELYIRYLLGDRELLLFDMNALSLGTGPQEAAVLSNRVQQQRSPGGRPLAVPPAGAWVTLNALREQAVANAAARKKKTTARNIAHKDAFDSCAEDADDAKSKRAVAARTKALVKIGEGLVAFSFKDKFDSLASIARLFLGHFQFYMYPHSEHTQSLFDFC